MTTTVRRRRVAVAILAAAVLTAGAACSSGGSSSGGKVTLTLLTHYGNEPLKGGLQKLVDQWNTENPKIHVQTQSVNFNDLLSTVTVRQTGGRGADMVNVYALWGGQLQQAHVLADPPASVTNDVRTNYSKAASAAVTYNGKVLGYPTEVETYVLFYNKKLMAAGGIAHPPTTWTELEADAKRLSKHDSKGNTTVEGLSVLQSGDNQSVHPFLSLLNSAGGKFLSPDNKTAAFDQQPGQRALAMESRIAKAKATDPALDAEKAFPSDKVAMAIQAGWWIGELKNGMGARYAKEVGTAPIPGPQAGQHGSLAYAFVIGVNSRSKHKEQDWKFLTWLNSHKEANGVTGMGEFLNSQGIIPGRVTDAAALKVGSQDPNVLPVRDALAYAMAEPDIPQAEQVKTALHQNIMSVLTGQKSSDTALKDAAAAANSALGQ